MTLVTKSVNGNSYYYYHDNIKGSTISTEIGRTDLDENELLSRRTEALEKHFIKIFKATSLIQNTKYKFENKPSTKANIITRSQSESEERDTNDATDIIDSLEFIKIRYNQFMVNLLPHEIQEFHNTFFLKYVHGTTAIEGNTLTENEASKLLTVGLTSNNKPLNENIEVANFNDIRKFMGSYHGEVTEKLIKDINRILMKGVKGPDGEYINAGEYRKRGATITAVWFRPPPADEISQHIHYALRDYNDGQKRNIHPVELASMFHQKFEEIHPFQDGNGRTGREILNYMLRKNQFPPIYLIPKQRSEYLNALEEGNKPNYVPLIDFIIGRMEATLLFLSSRGNMRKIIKSEGNKKFFLTVGDEATYNEYVKKMEAISRSEELP